MNGVDKCNTCNNTAGYYILNKQCVANKQKDGFYVVGGEWKGKYYY